MGSDRFIEYEPKDEKWCRAFGIGHEVREPACFRVGDKFVMHPRVFERLKRAAA